MISLASPAKINLFLRIMRRRSDGYHELASLFQTISLCDQLHVSLSDSDELFCNDPRVPTNRSNLIWKAIDLFRQKTGLHFFVKIQLDKQIPIQAGLGGGSSNAASALWAVNQLTKDSVSVDDLQKWSAEIGSDVPFFFSSGTAYCTGRGEQVRSLDPLPDQKLWIFKPNEGLSTPSVYKQLCVSRLEQRDPEECLKFFLEGDGFYFNDLEGPAKELMPALKDFKNSLRSFGFNHLLLSGSGTSFICLGEPKASLPEGLNIFHQPACFINRSLLEWYEIR